MQKKALSMKSEQVKMRFKSSLNPKAMRHDWTERKTMQNKWRTKECLHKRKAISFGGLRQRTSLTLPPFIVQPKENGLSAFQPKHDFYNRLMFMCMNSCIGHGKHSKFEILCLYIAIFLVGSMYSVCISIFNFCHCVYWCYYISQTFMTPSIIYPVHNTDVIRRLNSIFGLVPMRYLSVINVQRIAVVFTISRISRVHRAPRITTKANTITHNTDRTSGCRLCECCLAKPRQKFRVHKTIIWCELLWYKRTNSYCGINASQNLMRIMLMFIRSRQTSLEMNRKNWKDEWELKPFHWGRNGHLIFKKHVKSVLLS